MAGNLTDRQLVALGTAIATARASAMREEQQAIAAGDHSRIQEAQRNIETYDQLHALFFVAGEPTAPPQPKAIYKQAFTAFTARASELQHALQASTQDAWEGKRPWVLELLPEGRYRLLEWSQVGDNYQSEGILLPIPVLDADDYDDNPDLCFFDNAIEELRDHYRMIPF